VGGEQSEGGVRNKARTRKERGTERSPNLDRTGGGNNSHRNEKPKRGGETEPQTGNPKITGEGRARPMGGKKKKSKTKWEGVR